MPDTTLDLTFAQRRKVQSLIANILQSTSNWSEINLYDKDFPMTILPCKEKRLNRIILASKWDIILRHGMNNRPVSSAIACKTGIWDPLSIEMVASIANSHKAQLWYIGDLDVVDLSSFILASLSFSNYGIDLHYGGINDKWIDVCKNKFRISKPIKEWESVVGIALSSNETAVGKRLIKEIPNLSALIGQRSTQLLLQGTKIELEGVSNELLYKKGFIKQWQRFFYGKR